MKHFLLKTMLLLCALVVGGSAWAADVTVLTEDFDDGSANGWTLSGKTSFQGTTGAKSLQIASGSGSGTATTPAFSSLVGTTATLTFKHESSSSTATRTLTITGNNCKVNGQASTTVTVGTTQSTATITITEASTSSKISFSAASGQGTKIDDVVIYYSSDPSSNVAFANTTPSITYPATKTYSQAPTTADGYTGTISYSITTNTAGASIDSSTGLVTVTKGGEVTVKATAAAVTGSFSLSEATYTLTVNDTRTDTPDLAWSSESANVTFGADNNVFPTLTNNHNVPVTYVSTNTSAATIDENTGVITLKDISATTTINAVFAGNDDYLEQTVSYTLNVTKASFSVKDGVFDFENAANADPLEDYGSGMTLVSTNTVYTTTEKTWMAGNVTMVTFRESGNGYRWWNADKTLRFYNGSGARFSVPTGYVITKIETTGANFDNSTPAGLSGATWSGASNEVILKVTSGRNIKAITITYTTENQSATIGSTGWTTFSSPYALDLSGLTASTGAAAAYYAHSLGSGNVVVKPTTETVAAGEGLLLKGTVGATVTIPVATAGTAIVGNMMVGCPTETVLGTNGSYYVLVNDGTGVAEFQSLADHGATIPAGKAYLNAGSSQGKLRIVFDEEATGINEVLGAGNEAQGTIFDMTGRKVTKATRGLYIVNGKKVFIK